MISYVKQEGNTIYVFNENNTNIMIKNGELVGYTSETISIKQGNTTYVFDEKGSNIRVL